VDYLERLPQTLHQYDTLRLDAVAFACTGSSYLLGAAEEARLLAAATATIGAPVETATGAIREALARAGARRIVLVSPYPAWLQAAAVAYWEAAGLAVLRTVSIATGDADTRGIYELGSADAAAALATLDMDGAEAVLLSGTGLPTLAVLRSHGSRRPLLLSSNLCLAWRLQAHLPDAALPATPQGLLA
jgi:maleate isomerase